MVEGTPEQKQALDRLKQKWYRPIPAAILVSREDWHLLHDLMEEQRIDLHIDTLENPPKPEQLLFHRVPLVVGADTTIPQCLYVEEVPPCPVATSECATDSSEKA